MALGIGLIAAGTTALALLIAIWPAVEAGNVTTSQSASASIIQPAAAFTPDSALLLVVVLASALGGFVHAGTSFSTYVGNRRLNRSWLWWYLLRILIGVALAVLFYFVVRGGLLSGQAPSTAVNPYGIAALAALVGLFSKQATDKLRELFETMFRTAPGHGDDERKDKAANPQPILYTVEPHRIPIGETATLMLTGRGFIPTSIVHVAKAGQPNAATASRTMYLSATEVAATIKPESIAEVGEMEITVRNPEPGGGPSNPLDLEIHSSSNESG